MNAESDSLRTTFADQLSSFDDKLASKADDVQMLAEIRAGIGRLLEASGGALVPGVTVSCPVSTVASSSFWGTRIAP